MAHFAEINSNNLVLRIVVIDNSKLLLDGLENEKIGIEYCRKLFGFTTEWAQTFYNGKVRAKFACMGDTWRPDLKVFISPKPFASWELNIATYQWQAPKPCPSKDNNYIWNEEKQKWIKKTKSYLIK